MLKLKLRINGEEKECEVLYTFKSQNTNKDYLVCTDNTYENKELNIYAFLYYPEDKSKGLEKIEDENDYKEVQKFLDVYRRKL